MCANQAGHPSAVYPAPLTYVPGLQTWRVPNPTSKDVEFFASLATVPPELTKARHILAAAPAPSYYPITRWKVNAMW